MHAKAPTGHVGRDNPQPLDGLLHETSAEGATVCYLINLPGVYSNVDGT